jgi:TetR/AcrR family transcriptional regulator, cholesterol catabolism regulator
VRVYLARVGPTVSRAGGDVAAVRAKQVVPGRPLNQADILQAAVEAFATRGYRGTNLINVAERLGVTRQALYYYFPRKHDMLKAIMFGYFDGLEKQVGEAADNASDPGDRFLRMLAAHFTFVASKPVETTVFMHEAGNLPKDERDDITRRRVRHQKRFLHAYEEAANAGEFIPDSPGLVVSTLLGAANWSYRWFKPTGGRLTAAQYAAFAINFLKNGFGRDSTQGN